MNDVLLTLLDRRADVAASIESVLGQVEDRDLSEAELGLLEHLPRADRQAR